MVRFSATHWSVVLTAGGRESSPRQAELETLCRTYWPPIYTFVRYRGHRAADASLFELHERGCQFGDDEL